MLELKNLTKKYNDNTVLNDLSLSIKEGLITGFLGPNGAGKTTTMRLILDLATPTSGTVSINGKSYKELQYPLRKIGALINTNTIDERLTPFQYLQILAIASDVDKKRILEVLSIAGIYEIKDKKIQTFSLGMKQRLGIAGAIIGDPNIILLDEPFNGLDVDGIHWIRSLMRKFANEGKTVVVSSHLLGEVQEVADRIIVIAQGNLLEDMNMEEMKKKSLRSYIFARSDNNQLLKMQLIKTGSEIKEDVKGNLNIYKFNIDEVGEIAYRNNICIYELTNYQPSLEQLYSELVAGKVDYRGK